MADMFFPEWGMRSKRKKEKKKRKTDYDSKNPHAVALGKLGGQKGGPARAKKLTAMERSQIASKAAKARWRKK
jgi:hypothetical protein